MLSFFPRGVLDEILNLTESVSEDFPSYSFICCYIEFNFVVKNDLSLKAPIMTAADDTHKYFSLFYQRKQELMFQVNPLPHIKYQALFSS